MSVACTTYPVEHVARLSYQRHIDGLRALAVLAVVFFHAFPTTLASGFVGVDIFFVISGYLISGLIIDGLRRGEFSVKSFYVRRVNRIIPALLVVLVATLALGWYSLLAHEFKQITTHIAASVLFVSNLQLWTEAGYFDNSAETKPLLHLWSLAIEEQFYLIWPLLLLSMQRFRTAAIAAVIALAAASFGLGLLETGVDPVTAFYWPLFRFWELMLGAFVAALANNPSGLRFELKDRQTDIMGVIGITLIGAAIVLVDTRSAWPGWWALLPTLGAAAVLMAGERSLVNRRVLSAPPLVAIGVISYPLYLWHWPVLVFPLLLTPTGSHTTPAERIWLIMLTIALAWLTYQVLERRIDRGNSLLAARSLSIAACILVVAAAGSAGMLRARHDGDELERIVEAKVAVNYVGREFARVTKRHLRYSLAGARAGRTAFIGDSNMEQYAPRIAKVLASDSSPHNSAILIGNQKGCSVIGEMISPTPECASLIAEMFELLNDPRIGKVAIAAHWLTHAEALSTTEGRERFAQSVRSLSRDRKLHVILNIPAGAEVDPLNFFEGSRLGTLRLKETVGAQLDRAKFAATYDPVHTSLKEVAHREGAVVLDPSDVFCASGSCPILDSDGRPLYRDPTHLTVACARERATFIDALLRPDN